MIESLSWSDAISAAGLLGVGLVITLLAQGKVMDYAIKLVKKLTR